MIRWRKAGPALVGLSGAPGHQAAEIPGNYGSSPELHDRWDPAVAVVGDMWDTVLKQGVDVWAARAPSDFHNTEWDYWPGEFSETWLYVPSRDASGVLKAFHAGCFFANHGHIARKVQLSVQADGLNRPATAGETIVAPVGKTLVVRLEMEVPDFDWKGAANKIDEVELIGIRVAARHDR